MITCIFDMWHVKCDGSVFLLTSVAMEGKNQVTANDQNSKLFISI